MPHIPGRPRPYRRSSRASPCQQLWERASPSTASAGTSAGASVCQPKVGLVLLLRLARELGVDLAGGRVSAERATEEEDVGLGGVARVVHPPSALLDAHAAPLGL